MFTADPTFFIDMAHETGSTVLKALIQDKDARKPFERMLEAQKAYNKEISAVMLDVYQKGLSGIPSFTK